MSFPHWGPRRESERGTEELTVEPQIQDVRAISFPKLSCCNNDE